MRAALLVALVATTGLSGCMNILDQIQGLSDCGPVRTKEWATSEAHPLLSAAFFAGVDTSFYTWELQAFDVCPREHAKASASFVHLSGVPELCQDFTVKRAEVEVTKEYVPYRMGPIADQPDRDELVNSTWTTQDVGLAQAFGEDKVASYTVRFELGYPSSGNATMDRDCVEMMAKGVYLWTSYHEFKAK